MEFPEYIYVLKLENGKYYVGKTNNVLRRVQEHTDGRGSKWTELHKFVELVDVFPVENCFDEDTRTLLTMKTHGVDNVRGGTYSTTILTQNQLNAINASMRTSDDLCYACGKSGHFSGQCNATKPKKQYAACRRCHRQGHDQSNCYAKTTRDGKNILTNNNPYCLRCCRQGHDQSMCYAKTLPSGANIVDAFEPTLGSTLFTSIMSWATDKPMCSRCWKAGHMYPECS